MISFNKEQIYIVTGASSGIGKGTALLLNALGASVIGIARNKERLNLMKSESKFPENMHIEVKDLTEDIEGLSNYVTELKNKYGKFSGLAYCAGIVDIVPARMLKYSEAEYMFKVNYFAPLFFTKGFLDRRNNIGRGTSVVAISSAAQITNMRGMTIYSSTKAALRSAYKCIAAETAAGGVRVNTISPTDIKTPMVMNKEINETMGDFEKKYPMGVGKIEDVANFIVFLLSSKSKWITRQNYVIDCGSI